MVNFLKKHPCFPNFTTQPNQFAHNLDLPMDITYKIKGNLSETYPDFHDRINSVLENFRNETGCNAHIAGNMNNYIVLDDIDADQTIMSMNDLRHRVRIVSQFDKLCDTIRTLYMKVFSDKT